MKGSWNVKCGICGENSVTDWKSAVNEGCPECGSHNTEVTKAENELD